MLIGDVARRSGISARMLRHYNAIGLVVPRGRTSGGYREYSDEDMRRLFHVEALRSLGLSLADVKRALDDPAFAPAGLVADMIDRSRERVAHEQQLLARLQHIRDGGPEAWTDVVDLVSLMRGLASQRPEERQQIALAAEGAAMLPASALVDAVLAEDDPNVAGALQWALAREGDEAVPALATALADPAAEVRLRATVALAKVGTTPALEALTRALRDDDAAVRARAAVVLGRAGVRDAMPELLRMIVRGLDDVDAAEALGAIARRHGTEGETADAVGDELARADASAEARVRLTQALAELPAGVAAPLLTALAGDGDHRVALIATYLLGSVRIGEAPTHTSP